MMRIVIFIYCLFVSFVICTPLGNRYFKLRDDVVYTVEVSDNRSTCKDTDAELWSYDFHSCFIDRKYADSGRDLNNIVDRILDHSWDCTRNSTKECRPNYKGFLVIMRKVIEQMKDYCRLYLDEITHGRKNIKDLDCVETSLSDRTYKDCFKSVFEKPYTIEKFYERNVEKAISCANRSNRLCSKAAKTSLNRIARSILGVKQPEKEDIQDEVTTPPPPPRRWYDYIFQPFISLWHTIKSWFGY